jgi:hypothetical protein
MSSICGRRGHRYIEEATSPEERYAGQGRGLKQVLEEMRGTSPANVEFAQAAARVLERRVDNASPRAPRAALAAWLAAPRRQLSAGLIRNQ